MEQNMEQDNMSMIEKLPPKMAFWAGVIVTAGAAFALAFIVLLVMMVKGVSLSGVTTTTTTTTKNTNTNTAAANTNTAAVAVDASKVNTDGAAFIGEEDAPLTIAYWTDYQCPFCQRNEQQTMPQLITDYVNTGKVKLIFKDFAFLGADSIRIGQYARAVWETAPDKFYDWHKAMFDAQGTENSGWATAEKINSITATVFDAATTTKIAGLVTTNASAYQAAMDADKSEGSSLGVNGTPAFIVGTQLISGAQPYATIKQSIDKQLN